MKDRFSAALYVWDYFYVANVPSPGDEEAWKVIERATCRIRESEVDLDPPKPVDVRYRNARRVRNAARLALRQIERLSVPPEPWVIADLKELQEFADDLMRLLSEPAKRTVCD